jgi:hypothetical protein
MGDPRGAVGAYREAIRLNPHDPLYLRNLAIALKDCGGLEEALDALERTYRVEARRSEGHQYTLDLINEIKRDPRLHTSALGELPHQPFAP